MTKKDIAEVFNAKEIATQMIYQNGMTPDDIPIDELIEMIWDIIKKKRKV